MGSLRFLIPYVIFLILTIVVVIQGEDNALNQLILLIYNHGLPLLSDLLVFLSYDDYGRAFFWIPALALTWILGYRRTSRVMFLSFVLSVVFGEAVKHALFIPRPPQVLGIEPLVPSDLDSSYPSGHALIAGTGAYASLELPNYLKIPLLAEAILVSYGRIYVGLHWPLDVVAGWLLGIGNVELVKHLLRFVNH